MEYVTKVEPFTNDMMPNVLNLFRTYFKEGDRLLTDHYHGWLYQENPFGGAKAVYICHNGRWVGFMALIPVALCRNQETLNAYFAVNVLVDPSHQGRSLFGRMITAACEFAKTEKTVLLGHPNPAALKFWQRKRMDFQEELRPALALPSFSQWSIGSHNVTSADMLRGAADLLDRMAEGSERWKVAATPEYLEWRFIKHPSNRYSVQLLERNERIIGVQITKKLRTGANLLIDQFMEARFRRSAMAKLPTFTICFLPDKFVSEMKHSLLSLPMKKRIPFFLTDFGKPIVAEAASEMLLSASDF